MRIFFKNRLKNTQIYVHRQTFRCTEQILHALTPLKQALIPGRLFLVLQYQSNFSCIAPTVKPGCWDSSRKVVIPSGVIRGGEGWGEFPPCNLFHLPKKKQGEEIWFELTCNKFKVGLLQAYNQGPIKMKPTFYHKMGQNGQDIGFCIGEGVESKLSTFWCSSTPFLKSFLTGLRSCTLVSQLKFLQFRHFLMVGLHLVPVWEMHLVSGPNVWRLPVTL